MDTNGERWNGRRLEWFNSSPPPFYNFAIIPKVNTRDAFWEMKQGVRDKEQGSEKKYEDIIMPKNTAMGIYLSALVFFAGFAIVWHIVCLAVLAIIAFLSCVIIFAFVEETKN